MAWLTGWNYRKSITLSRASGAVTNYQMKLLLGESSGATGENVDCGGLCLSNFNDIRFTKSDGTTLLDYWIESLSGSTPNQLATIWIEFDSIGTSATTFYMYYGKSDATAVSNGTNTFPFFDDFEWGTNGDNINTSGGGVTWTSLQGVADISTAQAYTGTRSARFNGAATYPNYTAPYSLAENILISMRFYKENAPDNAPNLLLGNSSKFVNAYVDSSETVFTSGGSAGISCTADTWQQLEMYAFDLTANTHSIRLNGTTVVTGRAVAVSGSYNYLRLLNADTNAGREVWIDHVYVRNWRSTEPAWGTWGASETTAWLADYSYRKTVSLSRASGAVTNYQMKLLVGESKDVVGANVNCSNNCLSSFDDIRFTNKDGTTLLDYWIESISGITPNQTATIWIEFDSIDTSPTTFYMYYGNASASAVSNGANTFSFFEDWSSGTLDGAKWTTPDSYDITGGVISLGSGNTNCLFSQNAFDVTANIIRARSKVSSISIDYSTFGGFSNAKNMTTAYQSAIMFLSSDLKLLNIQQGTGLSSTDIPTVANDTDYYVTEITKIGSTNYANAKDTAGAAGASAGLSTNSVSTANNYLLFCSRTSLTVYNDWVLVRRYLATEPAWGTWSIQDPYYGSTQQDGDYAVVQFLDSGTFTPPAGVTEVAVLVVAGGGGGGAGNASYGHEAGGGGAGGLLYDAAHSVTPLASYTVTVGGGGQGKPAADTTTPGSSGGNSVFDTMTAIGGGGGGSGGGNGVVGGSGGGGGKGGAGAAGTAGQGSAGGNPDGFNNAGGGGGAGEVGNADAQSYGGDGLSYSITGTPTYYAGGGAGVPYSAGTAQGGDGGGASHGGAWTPQQDATPNTGGGGAGGHSPGSVGGNGGSGIVIIRYYSPAGWPHKIFSINPGKVLGVLKASISKVLNT
jgi:hypothetical protein